MNHTIANQQSHFLVIRIFKSAQARRVNKNIKINLFVALFRQNLTFEALQILIAIIIYALLIKNVKSVSSFLFLFAIFISSITFFCRSFYYNYFKI